MLLSCVIAFCHCCVCSVVAVGVVGGVAFVVVRLC